MQSLLYATEVPIADGVIFRIHTIGEIMEFGEQEYFNAISIFLAEPFDYMYPLYQAGIDYEDITAFQLFAQLKDQLDEKTIEFLLGDSLPLREMRPCYDSETDQVFLSNEDHSRIFTETTLFILAETIRKVHFLKREVKRAGNAEAKSYFLELAMKRARRNKNKQPKPVLEPLVIALVNAPEFPYTYNTCKEVTIYQFLTSSRQIPKRLNWNFVMHGVHVGMIDGSKLNWDELDWLS